MIFKTQFDVHNLVKDKYESGAKEGIVLFEVMEVLAQQCYGGTQIFYLARPIMVRKEYKERFKQEGDFTYIVSPGAANTNNPMDQMGWEKLREDQLVSPSQELIDAVLNKQ